MASFASRLAVLVVCLAVCSTFDIPWERNGKYPSSDDMIKITVALRQQNLAYFEGVVEDVSNPFSKNYGKYLTHSEIADILSPNGEYATIVMNWFIQQGVPAENLDLVMTKDVLVVKMRVHQLESLFSVKLHTFKHIRTGRIIHRSTEKYTIPDYIAPYVDLIHGISELPPSMRKNKAKPLNEEIRPPVTGNGTHVDNVQAMQGIFFNITYTPYCSGGSQFPCPTGQSYPSSIEVHLISSNPNIEFSKSYGITPDLPTSNTTFWIKLSVPTYVPINVEISTYYGNVQVDTSYPYPSLAIPQVLPKTLYALYDIPTAPYVTNPKATQCVVEFEEQYYSPSDLNLFFDDMGLTNAAPVTVIGSNDASNPGVEANLDIQWIMAMAPGSPTTFWSIYANSTVEIDDILQWEYAIGNMTDPPLVNSLSYGMTEDNVDTYLGDGYLNRSLVEFQKLASMGLTIIIADGDVGANDLGAPPMSQPKCFPSHADWPSNSPYVTAVGSTFITPLDEPVCYKHDGVNCLSNPLGEATVSVDIGLFWTTGGGFSNFSSMPSYQTSAVSDYFLRDDVIFPPPPYYNPNGRGYADAVTVGHNLMVAYRGDLFPVDGTSASAPIFAGIITLLNNARLNAGKSPLGALNPMLYSLLTTNPTAFTDITVGENKCGSYGWLPICCPYGYQASVGWDPVSGLGSPYYSVLRDTVLRLP